MSQCRWGLGEPCGSVELGGVTSESDLRCQFEIDVWPWHCQLKIPSHTQLCWHPAIQKYTSLSEWDSTVYLAQTATNEFWDGFLRLRELSPSVFLFPVTQSTPVFYSLSYLRQEIEWGLSFVLRKSSFEMEFVYLYLMILWYMFSWAVSAVIFMVYGCDCECHIIYTLYIYIYIYIYIILFNNVIEKYLIILNTDVNI